MEILSIVLIETLWNVNASAHPERAANAQY